MKWDGTRWDRGARGWLGWGKGWDVVGWVEMGRNGSALGGMGWDGMRWAGMGCDGFGWGGMEWDAVGGIWWVGMGRNGPGWVGIAKKRGKTALRSIGDFSYVQKNKKKKGEIVEA